MKIGIVVSEYYWKEVTSKMLELALETARAENAEVKVIKVPGSFDIPLAVNKLLSMSSVDGVVTLGAVIKGETMHDQVISFTLAKALTDLALEYEKPVVLGVNGPGMTPEQAIARIERAADVTRACIQMVKVIKGE